jgi:hypothetical protein
VLNDGGRRVELDETWVSVAGSSHEMIARSCHIYTREGIGMGDHFRVLVAVEGLEAIVAGIVTPCTCFPTLWYSPDGHLITVDFSATCP